MRNVPASFVRKAGIPGTDPFSGAWNAHEFFPQRLHFDEIPFSFKYRSISSAENAQFSGGLFSSVIPQTSWMKLIASSATIGE